MKTEEVVYKNTFIDTIGTLTGICEQLIIENKDNQVKIRANNESKSCMYMISAPHDYFGFSCDNICILNYSKFEKFFKVFNNTANKETTKIELSIDTVDDVDEAVEMRMYSDKREADIKYRLANIDVIRKPVIKDNPNFPEFLSTMDLTKEQVKELMDMISLVEADSMIMKLKDGICDISILNKMTKNKFSQKYKLSAGEDKCNGFEFEVNPEVFTLLPNESYSVEFSEKGLIKFNQNRTDDISLQLYLVSKKN